MDYKNPEIPEPADGEQTAFEKLKEFAHLGIIFLVILAVSGFVFFEAGKLFGGFIPFSWEQRMAGGDGYFPAVSRDESDLEKERALQALADRVADAMDLDPGIEVTVHYRNLPTVNAVTSLGGHIYIFEGILGKLEYQEEVAALIAHEVGHVKERHVVKGFTGGVMVAIVYAFATGSSAEISGLGQTVLNLEGLKFTRDMEREADLYALQALQALYGDVGGFQSLFVLFADAEPEGKKQIEFFETHPITDNRLEHATEFAAEEGIRASSPSRPWILVSGEDEGT